MFRILTPSTRRMLLAASTSAAAAAAVGFAGDDTVERTDFALLASVVSYQAPKTLCEPDASPDGDAPPPITANPDEPSPSSLQEEAEQEDPYDDLPDEDEPTSCIICLANRQGPCRSLWRKVERCVKDHSSNGSSDGDTAVEIDQMSSQCDKYMWPWMQCTQEYRNLYLLYFNKVYQNEFIEPMEEALHSGERVRTDETPAVDWDPLEKFLKEYRGNDEPAVGEKEALLTGGGAIEGSEEWTDPELVHLTATVPLLDERTSMPLEVAYAKDQFGTLVGCDMFSKLKDGERKATMESNGNLHLALEPFKNRRLRVYRLYRSGEQAVLYESPLIFPLLSALPTRK